MKVHVVDGTYELFRNYYGAPRSTSPDGKEVGATRGLLRTLLSLLRQNEVTHVAAAFDHVVESFRNELFSGYKTSEGIDPELLAQFDLAERAAHALGIVVWPMVEFEADDAMAAAAGRFKDVSGVEQVVLCSPDKDLAQCVVGRQVVCLDRRRQTVLDEDGVLAKFGVRPESIPDYLALVGDSADGIPGIPGWGPRSTATVLDRYRHLEAIPDNEIAWDVEVPSTVGLARSLRERREEAFFYRRLATLSTDVPLAESLSDLEWKGAHREELESLCLDIGEDDILTRVRRWRG
ncbi:MAG: 5'-3' exonuclease H3TH domain-containing protein [Acidobacteriota bacterium]